MNEAGANQPMPLVHNGIMYLANTAQHDAGARRRHRRSDLGKPGRPERHPSASARCATSRSTRTRSISRPPTRAWSRSTRAPARSCGTWRSPIAPRASPTPAARSSCSGKVIQGLHGLRSLSAERALLHQRLRRRRPASSCGSSTPSRAPANPAATRGARCPTCMRAGGETWIAGSYDPDLDLTYWGIAQAKPWMPASRGNKITDAALYTASTVALRAERRHAGVALPAHARRVARPRRSVREGARRHRPREGALHDRQGRHPVEARAQDRQVPRLQADRVPERLRRRSIPRRGTPTYRQDIVDQKLDEWLTVCPSTEGGHNWQAMSYHPPTQQLIIPLSQSCMEIAPRKVEFDGRLGRHRRPAAASSRCPAATATSASCWRST